MDAKKKDKRWCFTSWDFNKLMKIKTHLFKNLIIGKEIAPTTNTIHYQGYCESHKEYDLASIKKLIDNKAHFEIAYANENECIRYCNKERDPIITMLEKDIDSYYPGRFKHYWKNEEDAFDVFNIKP